MIEMEVCANGLVSALAAQQGGAIRVELCDNLYEGGTTPSYAQIKLSRELLQIQLYPIIRPRGGDFYYSDLEFELMKTDIEICKSLKCDGVVIGMLTKDAKVDMERCATLIELAQPMKVSFHRAFDSTENQEKALEDIIKLGCVRILTSGGETTALAGAEKIKALIKLAAGRISIMPGAGIREHNIGELIHTSGAKEFHATAKRVERGAMEFRNPGINLGGNNEEYLFELTDAHIVESLIHKANGRQY
jgi:copper homeostasis protein